MKKWPGILKIIEIQHLRNEKIIWKECNVLNQLHSAGESFLLRCCFDNDGSYPPSQYYFGLDNRGLITVEDTLEDIVEEPSTLNGYSRQPVSSNGEFTIEIVNGVYRATSKIVSFSAGAGGWGPVKNIFMTESSVGGTLISSAALSSQISLLEGDSINLRMALSLQNF